MLSGRNEASRILRFLCARACAVLLYARRVVDPWLKTPRTLDAHSTSLLWHGTMQACNRRAWCLHLRGTPELGQRILSALV